MFDGGRIGGDIIVNNKISRAHYSVAQQAPAFWSREEEDRVNNLMRAIGVSKSDRKAANYIVGGIEVHSSLLLMLEAVVTRINKLQPGCMYCGEDS